MKFSYRAFDKSGRAVDDTVEAANHGDAREQLSRQGLFVTEITAPKEGAVTNDKHSVSRFGKKKRLSNLVMFTRQLFVLVSSGTPIVNALQALERQARDPKWHGVIVRLRESVEEGASLSMAMEKYPEYFDSVCRSLVAAGEQGGRLNQMLDRLATLARKQLQVRSAIAGAMVYPCLLAFIASSVLIVMLTFVLPRFAGLFETLDVPLPPTTRMLMVVSDILIHYWWALILGIGGAIFAALTWMKTPIGKRSMDALVLRLPIFGPMVQSFATARIARLLGVQFDSHVPMLEALRLTKQACGNVVYADLITKAEDAATSGQSIASAFSGSKLINPAMCEAIRNGEQSGRLGTLLVNIAEFMDEENEIVIKSLTSIIEPIILIVLGALVGLVAVSLFLPLFDLTAMTQGGG